MREIKFRSWHKVLKQFVQVSKYAVIDRYGIIGNEDLIMLQYTGIKDKNGKEIYEGDIVKICEWSADKAGPINKFILGVIKKGAGYFALDTQTYSYGLINSDSKDREVMGNIYENPELLKDSKWKINMMLILQ